MTRFLESHTLGRTWCATLSILLVDTARCFSANGPDGGAAALEPNPGTRVIHRFDFDERGAGNVEDVPKYWEPLRTAEFPGFARGEFDVQVGHSAPPSFHLKSDGRNVAYQYGGPETRVRPSGSYRVEGFIRSDGLRYARACLCAFFVDRYGSPLLDTLVRTAFIDGPGAAGEEEWVAVELFLTSAPVDAHTIGLIAWVLQESTWDTSTPARRKIVRSDVHGGAWFDDITVYRLPRVELSTAAPGNVIAHDDPQELLVTVADHDGEALAARVSVESAEGDKLGEYPVKLAEGGRAEAVRIPLGARSPGLYHARLDVLAGGSSIVSRSLDFVRVDPRWRSSETGARSFGVVVDPGARSDPATEAALLQRQAVRSVKLPVWTGLDEPPTTVEQQRATDKFLQELGRRSVALTGVFFGPPASILQRYGAYSRPLIDLLGDDPGVWGEELAAVAAPYAEMYRWWQVGPDGSSPGASGPEAADRFAKAAEQLRSELRRFITAPRLSAPASSADDTDAQRLPVEQLCVTLGGDIDPDWFPVRIESVKQMGYDQVSAFVPPLPVERYQRVPRLAEWARRIIAARHAGVNTVFVPQTWHARDTVFGSVTEPLEEFVVFRTIADVLGDATPGQRVDIAEGVRCLAFHAGDTAILALWDRLAPPDGRIHAVQLGRASAQVDLWGRSTSLERDEQGRQLVTLSGTPVFVSGVDRWLVDFVTSLALKPSHVDSGKELVRHTFELSYPGPHAVSGHGSFEAPSSLEITPRTFSFNLSPGRAEKIELQIRYPHSEPAGRKIILAKMTLTPESYYVEVPLRVEVGLADVEVSGTVVVQGNDLVLRHVVSNRSNSVLSFRGSAAVPGHERQYRPFANLRPGDTQSAEYRISGGSDLIGRQVRLMLRELNDGPRVHNLELTVP